MTTLPPLPPDGTDPTSLRNRVQALGLWGLLAQWPNIASQAWLPTLLDCEEKERAKRSLERRLHTATIGAFKPMADFDWSWPRAIDREAIDELFSLQFARDGHNVVIYGENGIGKTMILKNLAHHALLSGLTVRCVSTSAMLADLSAQHSTVSLSRRVARYAQPQLLCIDEVGYLSYDSRYADLLFEVVTRRYEATKSIVLTTNKRFTDWPQVFPNAGCTVTLVDRLIHRCECIDIEADSYRFKEAQERKAARALARAAKRKSPSMKAKGHAGPSPTLNKGASK